MFGIKTKKDKKIEQQEERIKNLESLLASQYYKHPHITQAYNNMQTVCASARLDDGMPIEIAKQEIARKMIWELTRCIYYDVEDENDIAMGKVLKGYLNVGIPTERYR